MDSLDPIRSAEAFEERPDADADAPRFARRLLVAFVLIVIVALTCWVVLPRFGVHFPPIVPLLAFGVMLAPVVLPARTRGTRTSPIGGPHADGSCACSDAARPIGCCGPRPVGEASRHARARAPGAHGTDL